MRKIITILFSVLFLLTFSKIFAQGQSSLITEEPTDQYTVEGQTATFSVSVQPLDSGYAYDYAWHKNGAYIGFPSGASINYTTPTTASTDSGDVYFIVVTKLDTATGPTIVDQDTSKSVTLHVTASGNRVTAGLQVLYDFKEASGDTIFDKSNVGSPLNVQVSNMSAVTWTPEGLGTNDVAYINSDGPGTKVINAVQATNELTIEAWFIPAFSSQDTLSQIVCLSNHHGFQDFGLMQSGDRYVVEARSTGSILLGEGFSTPSGVVSTELTHLVFTRAENGVSKIYLNGSVVATDSGGGDFSNWWTNSRMQLANDLGEGPWLGTFYLASVYNRALNQTEINQNFNIGVNIDHEPQIMIEPQDQGLFEGEQAVFFVNAIGDDNLTYQWKKNGIDIAGANSSSYTIPSVSLSDDGSQYSVLVSNNLNIALSRSAKLYISNPSERITSGQIALYNFQEAAGDTIRDISNYGTPSNLTIGNAASVQWKPYGLEIKNNSPNISSTGGNKINNAIKISGEFTFEAWVKSSDINQIGNIYTISTNNSNINFRANQFGKKINSYLRTSTSPNSGTLLQSSDAVKDSLIHVVYTYNTKEISKIFVNGVEVAKNYLLGDLSNWNSSYALKLAEYSVTSSQWKGIYNLISIYNRALDSAEVVHNYMQGPAGDVLVSEPSNLSAQANFKNIGLAWDDNSTNEEGFIIERKTGDTSSVNVYSVIDTVNANETAFADTLISDTTTYTYRIKAYNELDESVYSNEVFVTSLLSTIPAPANLTAVLNAPDSDKVELNWNDNSSNETGFVIERKIGDSTSANTFDVLDSLSANEISYVDSSIADTTLYTYRVYAFNADTVSDYSNEATVTSLLLTIEAPSDLTAETNAQDSFKVDLSWTDNSSNESGFVVERKLGDTSSTNSFETIDSLGANQISYTDSTVSDSTTYTYRVYAYSNINTSDYSNAAQITTPIIVGIESFTQIPKEFELSQNYPNPFNPSTIIRYAIPTSAAVTITLYNTLGQEITKIYSGELNAGVHEVNFNASNLSSGVYFYRLEAHGVNGKNFISTKRMMLLK